MRFAAMAGRLQSPSVGRLQDLDDEQRLDE
jgi:hypothetical protein